MKKSVKFFALFMAVALVLSFVAVCAEPAEGEQPVAEEEIQAEQPEQAPVEETPAEETESSYMYELLIDAKSGDSFDLKLIHNLGDQIDSIDSYFEAYKSSFESMGFAIEKSEAGDQIFITKTFEDAAPSISLPGDSVEAHQFAVKKGWFADTYFLTDRTFDMSSYPAGENYIKVKLTTPFAPVFTNAMDTENGGKTSVFAIKTGFSNPITVIYKVYKPIPIVCLAMIIILLIVFILIVRSNQKKKTEAFEAIDSEYGTDSENNFETEETVLLGNAQAVEEAAEEAEAAAEDAVEEVEEVVEEVTEPVAEETEEADKQ